MSNGQRKKTETEAGGGDSVKEKTMSLSHACFTARGYHGNRTRSELLSCLQQIRLDCQPQVHYVCVCVYI